MHHKYAFQTCEKSSKNLNKFELAIKMALRPDTMSYIDTDTLEVSYTLTLSKVTLIFSI
jgi:hypothetical protein